MSTKCAEITAAGRPCRAWAIRGSDPPRCSIHAGRAHAPPGNQNARTHGFYSTVFDPDELADLVTYAIEPSLDGEIACARFALRRVLNFLNSHTAGLPGDPASDTLSPSDYTRLVALSLQAVRTIARLLRDQQVSPIEKAGLSPHQVADRLDQEERKRIGQP